LLTFFWKFPRLVLAACGHNSKVMDIWVSDGVGERVDMANRFAAKMFAVLHGIAAAAFFSAFASTQAATYYWDNNGSADGFGTAGGTWSSPTSGGASGWSQSSSGNVTIDGVTTSTSDALYFGTSTANYGLASGTVTVSGAVNAGDILFGSQSGAIALSGGTVGISSTSVLTVNNSSATISSVLSGSLAALTKSGSGTLLLTGASTYTGVTTISGGTLQIGNGGTTGSLSTSSSIVNNGVLSFNRSNTITQTVEFAQAITGTGSLIKNGAGTLALGGSSVNSYTGGTIVNAGIVAFGNAVGSAGVIRGALTINEGGAANPSGNGWSFGYGPSDSVSSVTINGGLLNFGSPNISSGYSGNSMTLTGGTIAGAFGWFNGRTSTPTLQTLASSRQSTISGGIGLRLSSSGTLTFDVASGSTSDGIDLLVSGSIVNATSSPAGGDILKVGAGLLVLSAANTYTGKTTISAGTLQIGTGGTTGSLSTSSTIANNGSLVFNRSDNIAQGTHFANTITGTGSLTQNGGGTLTLGQANSYTGGTIVNSGTLTLGTVSGDVGSIRGPLTINQGGQVNANAGSWSLGFGTTTSVSTIAVNGGLLNFTNSSSAAGAGYAGTSIVLTGGTIGGESFAWYNGITSTPTLQTMASSARSTISGGIALRLSSSGTLTFNVANGSTSDGIDLLISGPIANAAAPDNNGGAIVKTGLGRMVISGSNSYTGQTQVNAGSLIVNGALNGDVTVAAGATLGGSGVLGRTLSGAGLVSVGNSPGIGTAGAVSPSDGTDWVFEITGTAPVWNSGTSASVNDVLRLTDATPFATSLASGNTVDVLFGLSGASPLVEGSYLGGFFIDNNAFDLSGALANGQFRYWVLGAYGSAGSQQVFNVGANGTGVTYSLLSAYDSVLTASYTITQQTVNFGSGNVTGAVTQFIVVPEPASLGVAAIGIALAGWARARRRRIRKIH
jgi:fibronectin-binding autotransporter adhesin